MAQPEISPEHDPHRPDRRPVHPTGPPPCSPRRTLSRAIEELARLERSLLEVPGALLSPTETDFTTQRFTGCVYDARGRLVPGAQRGEAKWRPVDPATIDPAAIRPRRLRGRSLYLGHLTTHYGHFLLETLGRFWALAEVRDFDWVVFHPFVIGATKLEPFGAACLAAFGLKPRKVRIADRWLRCDRLIVPTQMYVIHQAVDPRQSEIYAQIAEHCRQVRGRSPAAAVERLYLSRSRFNAQDPGRRARAITNESEVEAVCRGHGFRILHPHELGFAEQFDWYQRVAVLAGPTGSALHNVVFAPPGATVIDLGDLRARPVNRNQRACNQLARAHAEHIPFRPAREGVQPRDFDLEFLRQRLDALFG